MMTLQTCADTSKTSYIIISSFLLAIPRSFEVEAARAQDLSHRLRTPPRALLAMDITQRNCTPPRTQPPNEPPPPAPSDPVQRGPIQNLHPPIPALPGQRRVVGEAVVRTNPRLRHHHHQHHHNQHHHNSNNQQFHHMRERQFYLPRFLSEESLHQSMRSEASCGPQNGGLYSSRIHSSADEISSVNRSPSVLSSRYSTST